MASTTVNFNLKTAGYVNYANQTLTFRLLTAGAEASTGDESYLVLPGIVTATSAANGDGSVTLFRNGKSAIDSVYEVILPNREKAQFIIPPGTSTVELSNLLVNSQPTGANTQQSSVYAQAIQRANHTGTQLLSTISDGTEGVQDIVGGMVTGNTETGIAVTYEDSDGTLDFVVASQTDQNFTNADHTKLDGIEASADVTDTANVTSAGALMDSECAGGDPTNVKALNQSVVSGASPTFVTTNMTDASDKRFMTNAQETKLDAIDADVTTLSLPASTTINDFARTSLLNSNATLIKSALGVADTSAIAGFVPNSITFPTTSDFLSIANQTDLNVGTGDFTLSFWARLDSSGTQPVLDKFSGTGYSLKFSSGSLVLTMQDAGGPLTATFGSSLNDNKWHVYVVSVDRDGNAVAYIDNVAQTALSVTAVDATLDNTTVFRIGFDGSNAGSGIALGNYIALHKSALTAAQAAQVYFSADATLTAVVPTLMVDLREVTETFTDVSASPLPIVTNGSIRFNQDRLTEFTGTNVLATSTLGYTTGSGGTVTQSTSKSTAVTLNKATGQITLNGAALAGNTNVAFTLTNSTIAANDILVFNHVSGGTIGAHNFNAVASSGSAVVTVRNITSGSLTDAIVLSFAVIKAVTS